MSYILGLRTLYDRAYGDLLGRQLRIVRYLDVLGLNGYESYLEITKDGRDATVLVELCQSVVYTSSVKCVGSFLLIRASTKARGKSFTGDIYTRRDLRYLTYRLASELTYGGNNGIVFGDRALDGLRRSSSRSSDRGLFKTVLLSLLLGLYGKRTRRTSFSTMIGRLLNGSFRLRRHSF